MIPPLAINLVTLAVLVVGFGLGYWYRGYRDRERAELDLRAGNDHTR